MNHKKDFSIIAAIDKKNGIGLKNIIPWRLASDMKWFRETTTTINKHAAGEQNAIIMGSKTWLSIPPKFKPLKNRFNIVLTKQSEIIKSLQSEQNVECYTNFSEALSSLTVRRGKEIANIFVIGGGMLYETAIHHPHCRWLYLTEIDEDFLCDVFFPSYQQQFEKIQTYAEGVENGLLYQINLYRKKTNNGIN